MKRIIPFILTFAIVFSLSVPFASADTATPQEIADMDIVTFFQAVVNMFSSDDDELGGFGSSGAFSGGGRTFDGGGFGKDSSGNYTSQKVKADYEYFVDTLSAPILANDGSLYWTPSHSYFTHYGRSNRSFTCGHVDSSTGTVVTTPSGAVCTCTGHSVLLTPSSGDVSIGNYGSHDGVLTFSGTAPYDGQYSIVAGECARGTMREIYGYHSYAIVADYVATSPRFYSSGFTITYYQLVNFNDNQDSEYIFFEFQPPTYKIVPNSSIIGEYNVNTRASSISGDYGVIGDNNTVTNIGSQSIVNETNSSVYNPVTGDTTTYDSWTYDYSSRTYSFTVSNDDNSVTTSTVEYGDENITITEGDTTYNIYYLVSDNSGSGSGSGSGTGDSHTHSYTSTVTTEPTCILPGVRTKTCSCGDTFTESIPATGHFWEVKDQVLTEYDDSGQIVTAGYVIYKCSVCDEEYKSTDGSAPPNSAGSNDETGSSIISKIATLLTTIMSGIWEVLKVFIGFLLDCLTDLFSMIAQCFASVAAIITDILATIPTLFTGFIDLLALVFPFLPDDLITILTFGILAVVVIGIIRAIRRW